MEPLSCNHARKEGQGARNGRSTPAGIDSFSAQLVKAPNALKNTDLLPELIKPISQGFRKTDAARFDIPKKQSCFTACFYFSLAFSWQHMIPKEQQHGYGTQMFQLCEISPRHGGSSFGSQGILVDWGASEGRVCFVRIHVHPTKPIIHLRRASCTAELQALGSRAKYAKKKKQYALFLVWDLAVIVRMGSTGR